jgi:hypothetical protein
MNVDTAVFLIKNKEEKNEKGIHIISNPGNPDPCNRLRQGRAGGEDGTGSRTDRGRRAVRNHATSPGTDCGRDIDARRANESGDPCACYDSSDSCITGYAHSGTSFDADTQTLADADADSRTCPGSGTRSKLPGDIH